MPPKKQRSFSDSSNKESKHIIIETERKLVPNKNGIHVSNITKQYNIVESMMYIILKKQRGNKNDWCY